MPAIQNAGPCADNQQLIENYKLIVQLTLLVRWVEAETMRAL